MGGKYVKNVKNIELKGLDDLFGADAVEAATKQNLPLKSLVEFQNHPFKVKADDEMSALVESIRENGIIEPLLVREKENGIYEIVAGHRRRKAAELAGLKEVPVVISPLDDDQATILMVDSNLHREVIFPSEKAFAYKMKTDAMRHQGKKGDLTAKVVGQQSGDSERTVHRYIQLTNLITPLLNQVDNKKISLVIGVELSNLKETEQKEVVQYAEEKGSFPDAKQAAKLKEYSLNGEWSKALFLEIMGEKKAVKPQVVIKTKKLQEYFPEDTSQEEMEAVIFELLDKWKLSQNT